MAGYQLPIKGDQHHTVDRVSGSRTVQDRGVAETDSSRCLPSRSAEDMAGVTPYRKPDDWVFASPATSGKKPYWGQTIMRSFIRPAAVKIGIAQHIGWHTFRHYSDFRTIPGETGIRSAIDVTT